MAHNLWSLLQPAFQRYRDNPAWICRQRDGRRVVTYGQLHQAALSTAARLRAHGIQQEDTVGITAPNGPEFTIAALAAWKIGANIAPIHIGNSDHEIAKQLEAVAPAILLRHESEVKQQLALEMPIVPSAEFHDEEGYDEEARIAQEASRSAEYAAEQLAVRIYTSGSTGQPKVVRLCHDNLVSNVLAACKIAPLVERDRFISLLPFSHAMGLMGNMLLPLYHGCAIVSPKVLAAAEILEALQQERVSVVIAVPRLFRNIMHGLEKKFRQGGAAMALYRALMRRAPLALRQRLNAPIRKKLGGKIKAWVSGGSHLDSRISRYYHDLGLPLRQGYGLTETAPLISIQEDFDSALESVGKPIERVRVKVHDPDASGNGEIWIAGPNVMLGYEDHAQTAQALQDGWFQSGDIGRLDDTGRIFLTGRSKRLIVTEAGKNIYPEELETLLERAPEVKEAGVLEAEMRPVCILAMDGERAACIQTARGVLAELNRMVSAHNRITRFALVAELPRTPLGKMALQELPAVFAQHEVTSH